MTLSKPNYKYHMKTLNHFIISSTLLFHLCLTASAQAQQKATITANKQDFNYMALTSFDWSFWDDDYKQAKRFTMMPRGELRTKSKISSRSFVAGISASICSIATLVFIRDK